jgi:hypothetical protein
MSALDNQLPNQNFLSPLNFAFRVKRAPGVTWSAQELLIPGIALPSAEQGNPFIRIPKPGEHLTFDSFQVTFRVDEDLVNYLEIFNWMKALGFAHDFSQYKKLKDVMPITNEGITSELTVQLLKSNRLVNFEITFHDAFPISLSDINLTTKDETVDYPECTVVFDYSYFEINKLNAT